MTWILSQRIVRWQYKLLYVVSVWVIIGMLIRVLAATGVTPFTRSLIGVAITTSTLLISARIFRGFDESVAETRPWWRMTSRPKLSRRLGILFAIAAAYAVLLSITYLLRVPWPQAPSAREIAGAPSNLVGGIGNAIVAYFYLNSAVRMKRAGIVDRVRAVPAP